MRAHRIVYRAVVMMVTTGAFAAAGYFGGLGLLDYQNRAQLRDLAALLLHRAEVEADFAFVGLSNLVEAGVAGCDPSSLGIMRQQVYVRSTINDIRIVDNEGRILCAAFPETLSFDAEATHPTRP